MKPSHDRWMANRYALIEAGVSKRGCMVRLKARYDRPLEHSACIGCPYQSRHRWVEAKGRWSEMSAEAVSIDASLRGRRAAMILGWVSTGGRMDLATSGKGTAESEGCGPDR